MPYMRGGYSPAETHRMIEEYLKQMAKTQDLLKQIRSRVEGDTFYVMDEAYQAILNTMVQIAIADREAYDKYQQEKQGQS